MVQPWQQAFQYFESAVSKLQDAADYVAQTKASELELEGFIKRFEFTWELAWKLLKDYMYEEGLAVDAVSPRQVVRAAFASGIITDAEVYFDMLEARNEMSHAYSVVRFERVLASITSSFIPHLQLLHAYFKARA